MRGGKRVPMLTGCRPGTAGVGDAIYVGAGGPKPGPGSLSGILGVLAFGQANEANISNSIRVDQSIVRGTTFACPNHELSVAKLSSESS